MNSTDIAKLVIAVALVAGGIAGFYWLGERALVLRILAVAAGIAAGAGMAAMTAPGREFLVFAQEAVLEVKKVVWPSRKDTVQTTAAVFAFVVVMALFLWISDKTLEWVLYDLVLGWKKT
ncbi:MAG: preprotein translocase subunit SecE [Proteobacteria bacterium]|nr:preprotein translocase subunit SecE [Pseudomonadota bacterium]